METTDRKPGFTNQVADVANRDGAVSAQVAVAQQTTLFTREQQDVLLALQARYRQDPGLFGDQEMMRLRFVRWLYQNGRTES